MNRDDPKIGQTGLRTNGCELRHGDRDFVSRKLIRPAFDAGKLGVDSGFRVLFGVVGHEITIAKTKNPQALRAPEGLFP